MFDGQLIHYVLALDVMHDKHVEWQDAHIPEPASKKLFGPQLFTSFYDLFIFWKIK